MSEADIIYIKQELVKICNSFIGKPVTQASQDELSFRLNHRILELDPYNELDYYKFKYDIINQSMTITYSDEEYQHELRMAEFKERWFPDKVTDEILSKTT